MTANFLQKPLDVAVKPSGATPYPIDAAIELTSAANRATQPTMRMVQLAMQRLVQRIMNLQRSGRIGTRIRSAVLLPYVQTETQELINALHRSLAAPPFPSRSTPSTAERFPSAVESPPLAKKTNSTDSIGLKSLRSWLLWSTSRSSPDVMRLLKGQIARVSSPDRPWQLGTLRLVPFLRVCCLDRTGSCTDDASTADLILDLTADRMPMPVPPSVLSQMLSQDTRIYVDSTICQQPATVSVLLKNLHAQIQQITPAIAPYFGGITAQVRLPQRSWCSSTVQLQYRLEFVPLLPPPKPLSPLVKFADARWLQQYDAVIHHQQVSCTTDQIAQQSLTHKRLPSAMRVVAAAHALSDQLQNNPAIVSRLFTLQEVELDELVWRLGWGFLHSSYEGMQLLSGIPVTLFSPASAQRRSIDDQLIDKQTVDKQTTGQLRFVISLHVQTGCQSWTLDLISGDLISQQLLSGQSTTLQQRRQSSLHPANHRSSHLLPTAIVQSPACAWCQLPRSLHQLQTRLWQQIDVHTPELKLLLQPILIELYPQQPGSNFLPNRRSGRMQLTGQFELTAMPVSLATQTGN
ncbi:hypothetical protein [Thermocoleostomius sinensis]|uniref:Uncharacterized protein n=1 Tax=Thermocoleostomius sinensis A174 TaxID=2016057 RepID=A0A9E9C8U7_9CYAN|nr:hypothetical protein [Thermocoleostomius sinensis]WAL60678.1 hypothetical protein OXH18_01375 [Thermocoleostomius sinensis A174]